MVIADGYTDKTTSNMSKESLKNYLVNKQCYHGYRRVDWKNMRKKHLEKRSYENEMKWIGQATFVHI